MAELSIDEMREKVREADMAQAQERNAEEAAKLKPMQDFLKGKTLKAFRKEVDELAATYVDDVTQSQKINALRMALTLFM